MKIKIIVSTGLEHDNLSLQRKTIECDSYEKIIKVDSEQIDYKTYTFIKALEKNKQFENQIKKIRDKIGIPREGFTKKESDTLLFELYIHMAQEKYIYRHKWQSDMLIMWDNRSVMHMAEGGYDGYERLLHRITIAGDRTE